MDKGKPLKPKAAKDKAVPSVKTAANESERQKAGEKPAKAAKKK